MIGNFFRWLFGQEIYNYDANGKSNIFYLAPRSVWRRVKDVRNISVSTFVIGDENRELVTGNNLGSLFFFSLPSGDLLSKDEVQEKSVILRIEKLINPDNPNKISFLFFFVNWGDLHPGEYAPGKKIS